MPSVFTCLTCAHFLCALRVFIFTCLRRMHFRKCFQFLTCLRCLHQFHEMWYNPEPTAKAEMSKKSYFVFQNLDRFDFKLVLRKQPLWGVLKILIRMTYFEWITCQEPETLLLQGFLVEFKMILFRTIISKNSFFLILKISLYLIEEK